MRKAKVSVIISFYNSEKYIQECLESIMNQTLKELEIISIDDGSTDNTSYVMREISKDDSRVICITKSNGGLASSRKFGMGIATGEYITFVDGDDYIHKDMYYDMYQKAIQDDLDIVQCNFIPVGVWDKWKEVEHNRKYSESIMTGESFLSMYLKREVMPALWQRLFKNGLWKYEQFKDFSKIMSDHFNFPEWAVRAKKVAILNESFYFWTTREGSLGRPSGKKHVVDARNRFLSGISILAFSGMDNMNNYDLIYRYLMSYVTQTIFHIKKNDYQNLELLYETWDRLKKYAPLYNNVMMMWPEYAGVEFFDLLEKDREGFLLYIQGKFWKDMAAFINEIRYNGYEIS